MPLDDAVTLDELRRRLVDVGSELLVDTLAGGLRGCPSPVPQHGEVTIAEKITKEDLHLDWSLPAVQLARVVRLGRAWTTFGVPLTVLAARRRRRPWPARPSGRRARCWAPRS